MNCALTTIDNHYNPFVDFNKWFLRDVELGYNTCGKLARQAHVSNALTEQENDEIIESAIDSIIQNDFTNVYQKIYDPTPEKQSTTPAK